MMTIGAIGGIAGVVVVIIGLWLQLREIKKIMNDNTKILLAKIDADTNALASAVTRMGDAITAAATALKSPPSEDPDLIAWCKSHASSLEVVASTLDSVSSSLGQIAKPEPVPVTPPVDGV